MNLQPTRWQHTLSHSGKQQTKMKSCSPVRFFPENAIFIAKLTLLIISMSCACLWYCNVLDVGWFSFFDKQAYSLDESIQKWDLTHVLLPGLHKVCAGRRVILIHNDLRFYTLNFHSNKNITRFIDRIPYRCKIVQKYTCNHFHFHIIGNIWVCPLPQMEVWMMVAVVWNVFFR